MTTTSNRPAVPDALRQYAGHLGRSLEPVPDLEEILTPRGLTPRGRAWYDQYDAAVRDIAYFGGHTATLRTAEGPPWDEETMGRRPLWHSLLNAARGRMEREGAGG